MEPPYSTEEFWDREAVAPKHSDWMEHPLIRQHILRQISGTDELLWPTDWLRRWLGGRIFRRALSVGCGTGALERDLVRKGLVASIDAFDGSTNSLRRAQGSAREEGMESQIRYYAADFNDPALPGATYDAVFIHQAAHHVGKLEKLFRALLRALTPDGVLYLDEYVGPSRHYWNEETVMPYRRIYRDVPRGAKLAPEVPMPVQFDDLSEAIRSAEIIPQLGIGFDIRAVRGYGGNLLAILAQWIDPEKAPGWIEKLIEDEKRLLADGAPPFYALVVATPKRGIARSIASARYFAEPKAKRAGRELRKLLR